MFGKNKEKIEDHISAPPQFYSEDTGEFASRNLTRIANEQHHTNMLLKQILKELEKNGL